MDDTSNEEQREKQISELTFLNQTHVFKSSHIKSANCCIDVDNSRILILIGFKDQDLEINMAKCIVNGRFKKIYISMSVYFLYCI